MLHFITIRPVGAELFHADRRSDRHDEANRRFSQFCERALKKSNCTQNVQTMKQSSNVAPKFVSQLRCSLAVWRRFTHSKWQNNGMSLDCFVPTETSPNDRGTILSTQGEKWIVQLTDRAQTGFKPAKVIQGQPTLINHTGIKLNQLRCYCKKKKKKCH